jgi:hypothetical protein
VYFSKKFRKGVENENGNSLNYASVRPLTIFDIRTIKETKLVITHCDSTKVMILLSANVADVSF